MSRTCMDCSAPISVASKGRCRSCGRKALYADPAARLRLSEAKKKALKDPEKRQRVAASASRTLSEWHAKKTFDWSAWHKKRVASRCAWCPADRWNEYQALRKMRGVGAERAKAMIIEDVARAERLRIARMSPFERQMDALARGATLITKPVMRKADHAFSLTGSSMGQI